MDTKYVALQEGQEGLLGYGTRLGFVLEVPGLGGVEGFFVIDCLDLCVWASDWSGLLRVGGVSMSSAKKDTLVFLRKKKFLWTWELRSPALQG